MIYLITYLSNNEPRSLEWVVPESWNTTAIAQAFGERYPNAQLLGLEPAV
jgi:hypothetical protein